MSLRAQRSNLAGKARPHLRLPRRLRLLAMTRWPGSFSIRFSKKVFDPPSLQPHALDHRLVQEGVVLPLVADVAGRPVAGAHDGRVGQRHELAPDGRQELLERPAGEVV